MNRLRYLLTLALHLASLTPITALGQPGALDSSFGDGGVTLFGPTGAGGGAAALQADGKIVVSGIVGGDAALWRFHPDGTLDLTFGTAGSVTVDLGGPTDEFQDVEVLISGAILAAGARFAGDGTGAADGAFVARFLPDGTLDAAFGTDGLVQEPDMDGSPDAYWSLDVRPNGRIVAGGSRGRFSDACYSVQYLEDGTRDAAFGDAGVVAVSPPGEVAWCLEGALLPDGRYAFGGNPFSYEFFAARLLEDGTLDPSFDGDGYAQTSGVGGSFTQAMEAMPDGSVTILGIDTTGVVTLVRFGPDGARDPTFGTGGVAQYPALGPPHPLGSVQQSDGKILFTGSPSLDDRLYLARILADGALDPAFGTDGVTRLDVGLPNTGQAYDYGYELALQTDGRIVAGGGADVGTSSESGLVARFENDKVVANEPPAGAQPLALNAPTPNPVRGRTMLAFSLPVAGAVRLAVYDVLGREVAVLLNATRPAGEHAVAFEARPLPSGTYFVRLEADGRVLTRRLTLLR